MSPRRVKWDDLPLFADDSMIGTALLGSVRAGAFRARAALLEAQGFPKIDPRFGGRYTPAVRMFFDREYGLDNRQVKSPGGVERPETWMSQPTKRRA